VVHSLRSSRAFVFTVGALCIGGLASAQITHRASLDSASAEGNGASRETVISPSGRLVVFTSDATNLVAVDNNGVSDVFVRDPDAGTTERISVDSSGVEGLGASALHSSQCISTDDRFVVFVSAASNLVPNDTNGKADVFLRDRRHGTTRRVSVDGAGFQSNDDSDAPVISSDGRFVAFQSLASNLVANDANGSSDVFVRDLLNDTIERISVDSTGAGANHGSFHPSISSNGDFVAFDSLATNLDPADVLNVHPDVYLRDRQAGTTVLLSKNLGGTVGDGDSTRPSVSADASLVAYESLATNLVSGDKNGRSDVFVLDRGTGVHRRVSVDSTGAEADDDSRGPVLSAGGGIVAFSSDATDLVAGDTNGVTDAFVHLASTGETLRVSVDSAGNEAKLGGICRSLTASGFFCGFDSDSSDLVVPDLNGFADAFVHETFVRASWTNYGSGFPGTNSTPKLSLSRPPRFGQYFTLNATNSAGAATGGWLLFGLQPADVPTHFGGHILVTFTWIAPVPIGPAGSAFPANIPKDLVFAGLDACVQCVELDAGAAHGMSFTSGLELTIGQ
jgi:Tol biopolymer transport system component